MQNIAGYGKAIGDRLRFFMRCRHIDGLVAGVSGRRDWAAGVHVHPRQLRLALAPGRQCASMVSGHVYVSQRLAADLAAIAGQSQGCAFPRCCTIAGKRMHRAGIDMHDTGGPQHEHILSLAAGSIYRTARESCRMRICSSSKVLEAAQVHEDNAAWIDLKEMKHIRAADV
jgi:hypothetical protein